MLPRAWLDRWQERDAFDHLFAISGRVYREYGSRKTLRFGIDGQHYFAKFHDGVGWKEIIKNIFQLRLPVTSAKNEWLALKRLEQLGVNTACLVGYGKRGWNPAKFQSFVIMEELAGTVSLEDFCLSWSESPPSYALKRALIIEVAKIARTLHENGINHRDFYSCHFLLDITGGYDCIGLRPLRLYLIDLHRMQIRRRIPRRWRVKDIAGLYFSSMDIGLTKRDLLRFIRIYRGKPLKETLKEDGKFWRQIRRRGIALYRKQLNKDSEVVL